MDEELVLAIDRLLDNALLQADAIERVALESIYKWIERMAEEGGTLGTNASTTELLAMAKRELELAFKKSAYVQMQKGILDSFDQIIENAKLLHEEVNDLSISDAFEKRELAPARRLAVERASAYLSDASMSANVVAPLTKVLFEAVQYGYSITETQKAIAQRMNFGKYVGQIARDSMFQFDGTVQKAIADEYGLDGIRYVGGLVEDSRGQCAKWRDMKELPIEKLPEEIAWAKRPGEYKGRKKSGMVPETNTSNFMVYRGGYNCRHRAIPVKLD